MTIQEMIDRAFETAKAKGWHENEPSVSNIADCLLLIHSEVSEATEELRIDQPIKTIYYEEGRKPCGLTVELADVMIRIADLSGKLGLPLEQAISEKMDYNESRPYKHGGKRF